MLDFTNFQQFTHVHRFRTELPVFALVNDKLCEFTGLCIRVKACFNEDGMCDKLDAWYYASNENENISLPIETKFFSSPNAFEKGSPVEQDVVTLPTFVSFFVAVNHDTNRIYSYVYNKERMVAEPFQCNTMDMFYYIGRGRQYDKQLMIDGIPFKEFRFYGCEADVYNANPYRKVDANGVETIVYPECCKIKPNDEQMTIIKQIEDLMSKAVKELHVRFIYDGEDNVLCAFNDDGIRGWGYDPDHDEDDEEEGRLVSQSSLTSDHGYYISADFGYINSDDDILIKSDEFIAKEKAKKNA